MSPDPTPAALQAAQEAWHERTYEPMVRKAPERPEAGATLSGLPVAPLYTPLDAPEAAYAEQLGFPGQYPFTRGIQPTMYRGRLWTMRQYAGFGTAEETNARFRYLLEQGQTGLSVAFDLPTQMGYDSDDPMALGEVGKTGVAIDSLADMETLLAGIPLDRVTTSMTINAPAAILLAMYQVAAEKQGVDAHVISGTIQNDILKEYIARNTYIFPPKPSLRLITDIFAYCKDAIPRWNTISISGYHMREAGCTAVQEVAFTLADAVTYVEAAIATGLDVDEFAPQLAFFFCSQMDLLEEVAKFRAARRLWARIMKERFGAKNPKSMQLRFHTQTSGASLTAQQPMNNVVRTAIEAIAAVLGGTQSLHTNAMDEALSLPTEQSAMVALRTQQILGHEAGIANTVDPLAGSYHVEALTDRIEAEARAYMAKIDELGGMLAAIEQGYVQGEIAEAAYRYQREVDGKHRTVVGVNRFTVAHEDRGALYRPDPTREAHQKEKLAALKASRDPQAVQQALAAIEAAARGNANMMPPIVEAVRAYVTVGEICHLLRGVFGAYRGVVRI
ncbi:MAG: methylmalonyl-CoA mutase family protein [Candidatus Sericytochromatia bacterium]|nr:methylmalonyl-CoA mutase family protein [Candidatus Sericytochromatia bacterium]